MTRYVYGIIHSPHAWNWTHIPDSAETDTQYAYEWYRENDEYTHMEVITLNQDDFWRGWFFYNDMEYGNDACPCDVNTEEHLDIHWESNSGGGHYDCMRYEHIINGRIVTTRIFKTGDATMFDDQIDITVHHQFENRLTTNDAE